MTYVVAGVSGHTGRVAAETLLEMGKPIRVVVRDAAKGKEWSAKGAEVAVANLEDAASVTAALRGAAGAYLLAPPNMATDKFLAYQRRVVDALAEAVDAASLPKAVFLSSVGADKGEGNGPIRGIYYAENKFKQTKTRWTFLRAAYFMENIGGSLGMLDQGLLPAFGESKARFPMIATRDIGETAARLLVEGSQSNDAVNLAGDSYSFQDAADVLSKLLGKTINVAEAPVSAMAQALEGFGFPKELAGLYQEMTENMLAGKIGFDPSLKALKGKTNLETVLKGLIGR
jgi:uncharacterized protein YbjT (DUF2867 family)